MPSPSKSLTTVRSDLGGAFLEFDLEQNQNGFIGHRVLRPFAVKSQRGIFGRVKMASLLATKQTARASGSGYNRDAWEFEDESYSTLEHGFEGPVDDRDAAIYRELIDAELVTVQRLRHIVLQNYEIRVRDLIQNEATFTPTAVTTTWLDHDAADPVADVEGAINRLWAKGIVANALVITRNQYRNLRLCDKLLEKVASFGSGSSILPANINEEVLSKAFDLKHIIVAGGIENLANEGQPGNYSGLWSDDYATVCRVAESDDIAEPCIGRTLHWDEDGGSMAGQVESYPDDKVRADIFRVRMDTCEKLIHTAAAEMLDECMDAVTP